MKNKKILFGLFALIILSVPLIIILSSEDILENGHRHKLRLQGYDPFDPFRGKFLRLRYNNNVLCEENIKEGDKVYVTLEKDSLGFSSFAYASSEKPNHSDYVYTTVDYISSNNYARIETDNLSKYFINENKAHEAENLLLEYTRNNPDQIYAAIRVLDGEVRLEDIFIEETPLLEFLEKHE